MSAAAAVFARAAGSPSRLAIGDDARPRAWAFHRRTQPQHKGRSAKRSLPRRSAAARSWPGGAWPEVADEAELRQPPSNLGLRARSGLAELHHARLTGVRGMARLRPEVGQASRSGAGLGGWVRPVRRDLANREPP